jgi:hypothetical protein
MDRPRLLFVHFFSVLLVVTADTTLPAILLSFISFQMPSRRSWATSSLARRLSACRTSSSLTDLATLPVRTKVSFSCRAPLTPERSLMFGFSRFLAGCALAGAEPGATSVDGAAYLDTALSLYRSHLWRSTLLSLLALLISLGFSFVADAPSSPRRLRHHHCPLDLLCLCHLRRNGTSSCCWIGQFVLSLLGRLFSKPRFLTLFSLPPPFFFLLSSPRIRASPPLQTRRRRQVYQVSTRAQGRGGSRCGRRATRREIRRPTGQEGGRHRHQEDGVGLHLAASYVHRSERREEHQLARGCVACLIAPTPFIGFILTPSSFSLIRC